MNLVEANGALLLSIFLVGFFGFILMNSRMHWGECNVIWSFEEKLQWGKCISMFSPICLLSIRMASLNLIADNG